MHFIGQVKKRKADNEPEKGHENEESQSSSQSNSGEPPSEHQSKRAKKDEEDIAADSDPIVDIKQEKEKDGGLKCSNCDTSFFNVTTFRAHVSYYCKNRDNEQN